MPGEDSRMPDSPQGDQGPRPVINGTRWSRRWMVIRSVVTFFLGVAVIVDSLVEKNTATVGKLVVGLLLIGIPSMEDLLRLTKRKG
jgi:hypothetical protein